MNYIGSISILDRGDAPAQAVIDRNARSLAQRVADETRDELNKVMSRVHTIYSAMDTVEDVYMGPSNMEYLNDLAELEAILKDEIKKRQYQQQVTVFIVGYQDVCHQKLRLLQQVNEFFMENSKNIDEEDWFPTTPDLDLDEVNNTVEDSLNHAHELTNRLAELNKEMVDYMATMAEKKASNRGRKKIEKALQQAKEEVNGLSEKLLALQTELDDREEKVQNMFKQLDAKNLELQKYRTAAELGKQKIIMLQKELDEQKKINEETKADLTNLLDNQITALHESHRQELDELRKQHESEAKQIQGAHTDTPSEIARIVDLDSEPSQQVSRQSSKQESRPSTKDTRTSSKSLVSGGKQGKQGAKSPTRAKGESKSTSRTGGTKSEKEFAEIAIQDEGGDPASATVDEKTRTPATRQSKRSKSTLEPVLESDFDNAYDLFDEQSWAAIPGDQLTGRFAQYRRLSLYRIQELEEQLQLTTAKTKRKVATLKAQFQEHKSKWEAERKILIEQVDQTLKLQNDAEKEADAAMTQLEDFITEQERLEQEEESKRIEVLQASASLTPQDAQTPAQGSASQTPAPGTPHPSGSIAITPESEQELQRLMQQTDDAKVQELNARLGTCVSAPPAVDMEALQRAESLSSLDGAKIDGATEEEIRASSALSRASLREQYKHKLEEAKQAAEERRSKSPHIELPTQLTVDDELILDEDDDGEYDEDDLAMPDDMKEGLMEYKDPSMYEIGTSPPPAMKSRDPTRVSKDPTRLSRAPSKAHKDPSGPIKEPTGPGRDPSQPAIQKIIRKGTSLLEHPLLREYLKAYDGVVGFKEGMGKMFLDKDMMSAHQMTTDLETLSFDHSKKAMPQVEELTKNMLYVLDEMSTLVNNILVYDREPPVSSLNLFSREPTQKSLAPHESISEQPVAPPGTRNAESSSSQHSGAQSHRSSNGGDKMLIQELQDQYNNLKIQLEADGKNHQEQLQRNTVVMMEMQDTINELQRELSALGKTTKRTKSALSSGRGTAVHQKSPSPETSVMFTRLDSDRNAKIMKKAVMEDKLDPEKYKEAVSKMDEYVSLPAQRLAHLVKKYVHHIRMKEIEEKVKTSSSINEDVFEVLDKMENLQNQRARQWAERMDEMGLERLKLANLLMDTLETIEQESGIFLIKPMYSYRGREIKPGHAAKLSRPVRHQHRNATPSNDAASTFVPAPTPASNYRLVRHEKHFLQQLQQQQAPPTMAEMRPVETRAGPDNGEVKIMGSGMTFSAGSPRTTWNMQASQPWTGKEDPANSYNTPRILELDINRMLIGQNNISSRVPFPPTDDRLVNASHNTLRSYVTVNRPTVSVGSEKAEKRPTSGRDSATGASTRSSAKKVRVSEVDKDIPASLPTPDPLPPITPTPGEVEGEGEEVRPPSVAFSDDSEKEPPQSPPGSSMYQSTKPDDADADADADVDSTAKHTRASSRQSLSDDEN